MNHDTLYLVVINTRKKKSYSENSCRYILIVLVIIINPNNAVLILLLNSDKTHNAMLHNSQIDNNECATPIINCIVSSREATFVVTTVNTSKQR